MNSGTEGIPAVHGREEVNQVALHAPTPTQPGRTRRRAPTRPALAVPAYRLPGERIEGGHLPLAGTAGDGRELQEQFLLLMARFCPTGGAPRR